MDIAEFQRKMLAWSAGNRRDMPWRNTTDPYRILVSEVMLQQTQVSRVLPKYESFLRAFPSLEALAASSQSDLLREWQGLGYWNRALRLRDAARVIVNERCGEFPQTPEALIALPGVGAYTGGAVACFAFGCSEPFLDTNIRRVYLHFFFPDEEGVSDARILDIARRAAWRDDPREWAYALFDYGALELGGRRINRRGRGYAKQSQFEGSFRQYRAQALRHVLAQRGAAIARDDLRAFLTGKLASAGAAHAPDKVLDALVQDRLISLTPDGMYTA